MYLKAVFTLCCWLCGRRRRFGNILLQTYFVVVAADVAVAVIFASLAQAEGSICV